MKAAFGALLVQVFFSHVCFGEELHNPPIRVDFATSALAGGTTFQGSAVRGSSNNAFQFNVDNSGKVSVVRASRGVALGEIGDSGTLPNSGTSAFIPVPTACLTTEGVSLVGSCNQYVIPAVPFEYVGITAPGGSTAGAYHQVVASTSDCPTFDPTSLGSWSFDTASTVVTYGSGTNPLKNKRVCTVYAVKSGSNLIYYAGAAASTTISGPGSTCLGSTDKFSCDDPFEITN